MNAYGRTFHRGKSIGTDMRSLIIDDILSGGGDVSTEFFPGSFRAIGSKYKVSGVTVSNIWKTFCQTGATFPRHTSARGQPKRLEEPELDLIQLLIKCRPSITYKDIKENIEAHSTATASISAIGRAVRDRLPEGKMSWKKMIRPAGEKFTADNIAYCQSFIDFMSTLDPYRVKFFDEAGFKLPDCANPKYGHSVKGQPCVEIMRNSQTPNVTLNLLCGLNGVMYANTLNGASNTIEFLNFFHEASQFTQPDGNPILEYGDIIVVDNVALHRFDGGQALAEWLDNFGVTLTYLPVYSPELTPIELVFNKMKTVLHQYEYRDLLRFNIDVAIYRALQEISASDLRGFYDHVAYLNRM